MVDQAIEMDGRAAENLSVLVVTQRFDLVKKLRAASRVLASRGLALRVFDDVPSAVASRDAAKHKTLVFDLTVDRSLMGELPRHWRPNQSGRHLILLTDHRDPMFRRSAIKAGYTDCVCLEDAMRTDFLYKLYESSFGSRESKTAAPDFDLMFAAVTSPLIVAHKAGRIAYVNDPFFAAAGILRSNLRGVNLATYFPEISTAMLGNCPIGENRLLEFRRASGNSMPVEASFLRLPDELDAFVAIRF